MIRSSRLQQGDIVSHFKRYSVDPNSNTYLYKILCIAYDQQNKKQVVYQSLYAPFKVWIREYEEFMGLLSTEDLSEHPDCTQMYRFELVD